MGTYPETANVDYRLSFADQDKQSSVFRLRLQQINGSLPFPFSVCSRNGGFPLVPFSVCGIQETWRRGDIETWRHGDMEIVTWKYGDIDMETWKH
jgi:hypothetical protein